MFRTQMRWLGATQDASSPTAAIGYHNRKFCWLGRCSRSGPSCSAGSPAEQAVYGGSPVHIRALSIDGSGVSQHVEGHGYGEVHGYRLVSYDGERLRAAYE